MAGFYDVVQKLDAGRYIADCMYIENGFRGKLNNDQQKGFISGLTRVFLGDNSRLQKQGLMELLSDPNHRRGWARRVYDLYPLSFT